MFWWLGWHGVTKQSGTAANREQVLLVMEESNEYCCTWNLSRPVFKTAVYRLGEASYFHHLLPGTRSLNRHVLEVRALDRGHALQL